MIQIREYLTTKIIKPSKIKATDNTVRQIVKEEMDKYGHNCDLNHVDVSEVTYMNSLFSCYTSDLGESYSDLNPDISEWNVSNVTNMGYLFLKCESFNQDISKWDVSEVKHMNYMFEYCKKFNQDISKWDVSNVIDMSCMFWGCESFNQDIGKWCVCKVENMKCMFWGCESFNQNLSKWNVSNVQFMSDVFSHCAIKKEYKPYFDI